VREDLTAQIEARCGDPPKTALWGTGDLTRMGGCALLLVGKKEKGWGGTFFWLNGKPLRHRVFEIMSIGEILHMPREKKKPPTEGRERREGPENKT